MKVHVDNKLVSAGEEFKIYTSLSDFPFSEVPEYSSVSIAGLCLGGSATIEVFGLKRKLKKNDLLVLLPYQLVSIRDVSDDFELKFFVVPQKMYMDVISVMVRMTPDFFFYMRRHFIYPIGEEEANRFEHFCELIRLRANTPIKLFRYESVVQILRIFYWDLYVQYCSDPSNRTRLRLTHKEELIYKFIVMIIEDHNYNRDVAYYAERLHVTPKHLNNVAHQTIGRSPKELIVEFTILEIKALLRNTNMEIKEIVYKAGFPSPPLLSRFFKKYTGVSPTEYREQMHI